MKTPDLQGLRTWAAEWAADSEIKAAVVERLEEVGKLAAVDGLAGRDYTSRIIDAIDDNIPADRKLDPYDLDVARDFVSRFASQLGAMSELFACAANAKSSATAGSYDGWTPSRQLANLFGGVVPVNVAPENVAAVKEADEDGRYNDILDRLVLGPHQKAEHVSAITEGAAAAEIFVTTHILPTFQAGLAATLSDQRFASTPRLFLVDGAEPITNADLIAHASVLRNSMWGELKQVQFNCSKFHLAGGYADACLSTTTRSLIERHAASASAATPLTLTFHAEHIFESGGVTLAGKLRASMETERAYAWASKAFLAGKLRAGYALGSVSVAEHGGWATITAPFTAADGAHRGEMRILTRTAAEVLRTSAANLC